MGMSIFNLLESIVETCGKSAFPFSLKFQFYAFCFDMIRVFQYPVVFVGNLRDKTVNFIIKS